MAGENILLEAEDWPAENGKGMVPWPYQPGRLPVSEKVCTKRHQVAQTEKSMHLLKSEDDIFSLKLKKGLSLCRNCPMGKRLARDHPVEVFPLRLV